MGKILLRNELVVTNITMMLVDKLSIVKHNLTVVSYIRTHMYITDMYLTT